MDCSLIADDLLAYHLAALDDQAHTRVEDHLVTCASCLKAYLTLKRHLDRGGNAALVPSHAARARLRAAVIAELRLPAPPASSVRRLLVRRIPLYQGLAAATLAVVLATMAPRLAARIRTTYDSSNGATVDTSRVRPASLTVY